MHISLISNKSLNQLRPLFCHICNHPREPEPFLGICSTPLLPSLSVYRPDSQPQHRSKHHCAPVTAHLCLEQDASWFTMPGIAVPARPGTSIDYYRWKWHNSSSVTASPWTPTPDRIQGRCCADAPCALWWYTLTGSPRLGLVEPSVSKLPFQRKG